MSFPYSTLWRYIYYESIVEHDHRLRSICTHIPWINFDEIIDVDWVAAKNDDRIASHPIAIYLNKLAPKSQKFRRINKDVIYKRPRPVRVPFDADTYLFTFKYDDRMEKDRYAIGLRACSLITITPRNRWFKLYERNPRFTSTISALSTQLHRTIQARSRFNEDESAGTITTSIVSPSDKYPKCYKVRIYHRQAWNPMKEGASFPSIWKEPDPSASVDDVSGVALRHITLLCRDVICECNKCTVGCPNGVSDPSGRCDACNLDYQEFSMGHVFSLIDYSGSFAEGCMLPTFYVRNELNKAIKKSSDMDRMRDSRGRVGFNAELIGSNVFAIIEFENCELGYCRLRDVRNGEILSGNIELIGNTERDQNQINTVERNYYKKSFTRGPATTNIPYCKQVIIDDVFYYSCLSWPPIAQTWIDRERRSKWPPKGIIQEIVSKGCRIVYKSHPRSTDPDAEFRFSFSVAELILFETLSVDQKKCFIAFKALAKFRIYRLEIKTKKEVDLSTYQLKTIFLWACETIPADQWQTTNGWARCLLYMIDQLYACLKSRTLPGYFIPDNNLMDTIELPQALFSEIRELRMNPITSAATFLDSTRCFRHSQFKTFDHIQDLCGFDLIEENISKRQLIFLQKMTIGLNSTRGVRFWKKEAVLRIFATWCHQNSHEIHLAPWQCLTREMTLFDVVYLDILHGFDVPNNVLLEYVDREWSVEVVCKLATCYSMKILKRGDRKNKVEYSLHFKSLLVIHQAINYKHPTLESIITSVSILMRCKEYEMAAQVLKSAIIHICFSDMIYYIRWRELYADLSSHKMKNELQEMFDIVLLCGYNKSMFQRIPAFIHFLLSVCYKYCGTTEDREDILNRMRSPMFLCSRDPRDHLGVLRYAYVLLMLDVLENFEKLRSLYCMFYREFVSKKFELIEREAKIRKDLFQRNICVDHRCDLYISLKAYSSVWSCTAHTKLVLRNLADLLGIFDESSSELYKIATINHFEPGLTYSMLTTADRIYFSQVLIVNKKLEQAISILESIVEQEGAYSISMVIWPKELYGSRFIDKNLRNELIKSSKDYIVFPTNLYARYLLTIAYGSLGQEENRNNNLLNSSFFDNCTRNSKNLLRCWTLCRQ